MGKETLIDISLPITNEMPIYPGTAQTKITAVKGASGLSVISEFSMTTHAGTHIDAPSHVITGAAPIDAINLEVFYGPCRVLDLLTSGESISMEELETKNIQAGERILLKTKTQKEVSMNFIPIIFFFLQKLQNFWQKKKLSL